MQYTNSANKEVLDHRKVRWVVAELSRPRSESEELNRVAQKVIAQHCRSGVYIVDYHHPGLLVENVKWSRSNYNGNAQ